MTSSATIILAAIDMTRPDIVVFWQIGLSVGMFLAVAMLIAAVFSQQGEIRLSPQREAAISTGHLDRKTVFESPYLRPLMWLLLAMTHRLAMPRFKEWIRRKLLAAGSPNYYTPEEYLAITLLIGLVTAGGLEGLHMLAYSGRFSYVTLLLGIPAGVALGLAQLHEKASKRVRSISKRVPYALDLIALAMGAGATFTEAVRTIVRENPEDPFNEELKTVLAEIDLGTTRRRALQNLADRVPLEMLRTIVASVVQSEDLGTPLVEVLQSQATLLRMQRSVRAENAAAVASTRILVPGVLMVMACMLAAFGPAIIHFIREGLF